jgi:hypothetical protein
MADLSFSKCCPNRPIDKRANLDKAEGVLFEEKAHPATLWIIDH